MSAPIFVVRYSLCATRSAAARELAEKRIANGEQRTALIYSPLAAIRLIRSWTRQEYPHSLSYHEITLTQLPATTRVMCASTIEERESPLKSDETSSFSSYPR